MVDMDEKPFYSVTEVAREFGVTPETVRTWIGNRLLFAIQPAGPNGSFRIPSQSLVVFRRRVERRESPPKRVSRPARLDRIDLEGLYRERIEPPCRETGLTPDQLLRRLATDSALVARYPSFAGDYGTFVNGLARRARRLPQARAVGA